MNRALDECPSAAEDRDRDRHRMSLETAPFVVRMVKSIGDLRLAHYKDSLVCEMVKETLKLLDNLTGSAVSSRLDESERLECATILIKLVASFHTFMSASENNSGLPGASGKLSAVELKPAVRALVMFVSSPEASSVQVLQKTAQHLEKMGPLLSRNDPKLIESVLSVLTSFLQSFGRLSSTDCDQVLGSLMRPEGPVAPLVMQLLATATGKIHHLVVSLVCSLCLLSSRVLRQLVLGYEADTDQAGAVQGGGAMEVMSSGTSSEGVAAATPTSLKASATDQELLLVCIGGALEHEDRQVPCAGLLRVIETVLCCMTDGHKATAKDKSLSTRAGPGSMLADPDHHKRMSDMMFEDDVEEMELREMLEADEIREEEMFRSRSVLGVPDRRRAELEIRMQRLRRSKIARLQEVKSRRRFVGGEGPGAAGVEGSAPGRAGSALARDLATGTRVKRGPDWKWHSQDGGPDNQGLVVSGTDKNSDGWVRVQWDKGGVNGYRWGAENSFDVEPVHVSLFSSAVRSKDLVALREAAAQDDSDVNAIQGMLTPLLEAINYAEETPDDRDVEVVVALVEEFGADPNLASGGRLPLHLACERARPDIVRALLDHKADPTTKDAEGLTALDFISRCIERAPPDGPRALFANYGKVLRILEDEIGQPPPIVRRFKFEKEGGQRSFAKGQAGFRYPMPSTLMGNSSFTISLRIKHLDPTGVRAGRACLLSLGGSSDADKTKPSCAKGFSLFLHTRGHMEFGQGLSPRSSCTSINIAVCRGRWATLTVVYDSNECQLEVYVDAKLKTSEVLQGLDLDPSGDILVGSPPEGAGRDDKARFHGSLADVQIHDKALKMHELEKLHHELIPLTTDAHPLLQIAFCESGSRMLLEALCRPMVGASGRDVATTKRQMLAILSRMLPLCSGALLSGDLKTLLVRCLENLISEAPSHSIERRDMRGLDSAPTQMVSLLMCLDVIMNTVSCSFEESFRRCGIVAKILRLSQIESDSQCSSLTFVDPRHDHSTGAYHLIHQPHDLALYMIETHFGGEQGGTRVTDVGQQVLTALLDIRASLEFDDKMHGSAGPYHEDQARQALEKMVALFQAPEGVYCEELLASNLSATLLSFMDSADACTGDNDAGALLENVLQGGDGEALLKLVACLRLAVDKMQNDALPLVLHEDGAVSDLRALKQWVTIRFEKCKLDKSDLEEVPTGHELCAEPLSLVKNLRSTLEGMLQSPVVAGAGRSHEDKQGELRAMMQAFGDDPEGAPPSLLEHMRHLVDAEPRSHDAAPPIQRKFQALPCIHSWDREIAVTGTAKRSLPIALTAANHIAGSGGAVASNRFAPLHGSSIPVASDNDDDDMPDIPELSSVSARLEMLRRSTARSVGAARSATHSSASSVPKTPIPLDIYLCFGKISKPSGPAGVRTHEIAVMHEYESQESQESQNNDEMQEDHSQGAGAVGGWVMCGNGGNGGSGTYATLPPIPRASTGTLHHVATAADVGTGAAETDDGIEHGVLLEDGETLFEAMTRLYAVRANSRAGLRHKNSEGTPLHATFVHPGRFWEQSFLVRYKRAGAAEEDNQKIEKDVCIEIPKTVMRHVLGRGGGGLRKIERESGAKIVQSSIGRNEAPMLRVSGLQDQIDQAVKLIHASAREASSWRESRDASILDLHRTKHHETASGASEDTAPTSCNAQAAAPPSASTPALPHTSANHDSGANPNELAFLENTQLRSCLRLLDRLTRRMDGTRLRSRSLAVSETLVQYVRKQLDDALVVGSCLLSKLPWMLELCKLHSILSPCVRERYFLAAAFGPSRALSTLHSTSEVSSSDDAESEGLLYARAAMHAHAIFAHSDRPRMYFCHKRPEHPSRVPELVHETVEIDHHRDGHEDKPSLMIWAEQILEAHSKRETVLDVTWKGEAGHGSGPTRKFFEKVAAMFGSAEENAVCNVWRDTHDGTKCGLFPSKLPQDNVLRSLALKRLRLIGLFVGKALQQRQMPGLCLAKPLFKLLIGQVVGYDDVKDMDRELGAGVETVVVCFHFLSCHMCVFCCGARVACVLVRAQSADAVSALRVC